MTVIELGAFGEFVGSMLVMVTLFYLAMQVRQNTAQQKREETISIQNGQNRVIAQWTDPAMVRAYVRAADGDVPASVEDRSRAIMWLIHLYHDGTLDEERYRLWEMWAVRMVASKGIRHWWDAESGKEGFMPDVRDLIDRKLNDPVDPPTPLNETWSIFATTAWESSNLPEA